jgi:hypothetical protein
MLPVVAEVVHIADSIAIRKREIAQMQGALIDDVLFVFRIGLAVAIAAQAEFMKVAILPSHDELNDPVQLLESEAIRHLDAAPDARLEVSE